MCTGGVHFFTDPPCVYEPLYCKDGCISCVQEGCISSRTLPVFMSPFIVRTAVYHVYRLYIMDGSFV